MPYGVHQRDTKLKKNLSEYDKPLLPGPQILETKIHSCSLLNRIVTQEALPKSENNETLVSYLPDYKNSEYPYKAFFDVLGTLYPEELGILIIKARGNRT